MNRHPESLKGGQTFFYGILRKGWLPIAKLDLIGWEKYDAGFSLVDISISILAILNNIEGQQLKD